MVLAVNQWDEDKNTLEAFTKDKKLSHRILLNGSQVGRDKYGVTGIPSTFWIDKQGRITHQEDGFDENQVKRMERWIKDML